MYNNTKLEHASIVDTSLKCINTSIIIENTQDLKKKSKTDDYKRSKNQNTQAVKNERF